MLKLAVGIKRVLSSGVLNETLIAKVYRSQPCPEPLRHQAVLVHDHVTTIYPPGYAAHLYLTSGLQVVDGKNHFYVGPDLDYLQDGDVVKITPDLRIRVLYRRAGINALLVTERCNSFCIMCSQPPKDIDDSHLVDHLVAAIPLIPSSAPEIGITGGEPTLLGDRLFDLLNTLKINLPRAAVHMLSNGRNFKDMALAERLARLAMPDFMLGIPVYSDIPAVHDYVVQSDGAFDETIRGILNLKRAKLRVEIRVVLTSVVVQRLPDLCRFIARNLQFVDQVSLMALEHTGFARANWDAVWIDPSDYRELLEEAVDILTAAQIKTNLFNFQLCILPRSLWRHAVKSISDWKNEYVDICKGCEVKAVCGGFFSSGLEHHPRDIAAVSI